MGKSCALYSKIPGFSVTYGGKPSDRFTTFEIGKGSMTTTYLNLELIVEEEEEDEDEEDDDEDEEEDEEDEEDEDSYYDDYEAEEKQKKVSKGNVAQQVEDNKVPSWKIKDRNDPFGIDRK